MCRLLSSIKSACRNSPFFYFLSIFRPPNRLVSGLVVGLSVVRSTFIIFESFLSGMFAFGLDISVDVSSSSKLPGVTLSARSDPTKSQKDISFLGSECVGVEIDCPVSLL